MTEQVSETVTIRTGVKNSSIRLIKDEGKWYLLPVGFSGIHLTSDEVASMIESFTEAQKRLNSLNDMSLTDNLF